MVGRWQRLFGIRAEAIVADGQRVRKAHGRSRVRRSHWAGHAGRYRGVLRKWSVGPGSAGSRNLGRDVALEEPEHPAPRVLTLGGIVLVAPVEERMRRPGINVDFVLNA